MARSPVSLTIALTDADNQLWEFSTNNYWCEKLNKFASVLDRECFTKISETTFKEDFCVERFILVLEENPEHTLLIQSAFQEDAFQVEAIADGATAMSFLERQGKYSEAPRPDLILLNLNLPGKTGQEILTEIKSDPKLRRIPVVILTSSDQEEDVFHSYALQGNSYVIKASDHDRLTQIVQRIKDFWLGIVTLPLE